jgi:uncharacterized membrane protein YkvA (DUF1232 family)
VPRAPTRLRRWAASLARQLTALAAAYRDPRTPLGARVVIGAVLIYALSPLDLIPDALPVVGLLDDLVLVPLGIALALRLLPGDVLRDARQTATTVALRDLGRHLGRWGVALVVALWAAFVLAIGLWLWRLR